MYLNTKAPHCIVYIMESKKGLSLLTNGLQAFSIHKTLISWRWGTDCVWNSKSPSVHWPLQFCSTCMQDFCACTKRGVGGHIWELLVRFESPFFEEFQNFGRSSTEHNIIHQMKQQLPGRLCCAFKTVGPRSCIALSILPREGPRGAQFLFSPLRSLAPLRSIDSFVGVCFAGHLVHLICSYRSLLQTPWAFRRNFVSKVSQEDEEVEEDDDEEDERGGINVEEMFATGAASMFAAPFLNSCFLVILSWHIYSF